MAGWILWKPGFEPTGPADKVIHLGNRVEGEPMRGEAWSWGNGACQFKSQSFLLLFASSLVREDTLPNDPYPI